MTLDLSTVAIVLDPDFGVELHALAAQMPVWIVDSPANRPAIEAEWTRRRREGAEREVTVFRMIEGMSGSAHVAAMLRTIDEHHGPASQQPPFVRLKVVGAEADESLVAAIRAFGGSAPITSESGFTVHFKRDS